MARTCVSWNLIAWPSWLPRKIISLPLDRRAAMSSSPSSRPSAMMPRDIGLSNSVSSHFLMTPFRVTITMYLSGTNSCTARNAFTDSSGCRLIRLHDVLALAGSGGVGDLVNLEPVDAAHVGEHQQVSVRRGDQEVLDEILRCACPCRCGPCRRATAGDRCRPRCVSGSRRA